MLNKLAQPSQSAQLLIDNKFDLNGEHLGFKVGPKRYKKYCALCG